jgi:TRAP-type C4-dicarboxylate transport system substrate-binding protein
MLRVSKLTTAVLGAAFVVASSQIVGAADPVKLRWASDHNGPPHPAAIAEVYFAEQVEKRIPGSKTSSIEPLANVLLGAGKLSTVGAIDAVDKTKTFGELAAHFDKAHDITIMGAGHLSMYMGAGAVKGRLIGPADFAGKKMRSMGPAENALLSALGANPQAMAFGDVPPALQTGVIDGLLTSHF